MTTHYRGDTDLLDGRDDQSEHLGPAERGAGKEFSMTRRVLKDTSMTSVFRQWSLVCALALVGLLALAGGAVQAHGTTFTAVSTMDSGYRYQVVEHGAEAGFEAVEFDDSAWSTGAAGFGTTSGVCWWNSTTYVQTVWPGETDILVRKSIELPAGAHNLRVFGNIDNNATVYLNGVQIGSAMSGYCIQNQINFTASDELLVAGTNVLAIRGEDYGAPTFLDVQVTYDYEEPLAPSYAACPLYDQTKAHRAGATVPIKLQLCDAAGGNLSSGTIVVNAAGLTYLDGTASALVEDSGNANPDADFRYDEELGGYVFNLSTAGLSSGTWQLTFTVDGVTDPTYYVLFDVR